jgi:signal transduction histidine kinase
MNSEIGDQILAAREQERARLARRLHDSLSQSITAISAEAFLLPAQNAESVRLQERVAQAMREFRLLMSEIAAFEGENLTGALRKWGQAVAKHYGIAVNLESPEEPIDPPPAIGIALYRIGQEAILNAARHSGAKSVKVVIASTEGVVRVTVSDAGCGFERDSVETGSGLRFMQGMAKLAEIQFMIDSRPRSGTAIFASTRSFDPAG